MKYDEERIAAIQRTFLTPNWIPAKEFVGKAGEDIHYLISVIHDLRLTVAELENKVRF